MAAAIPDSTRQLLAQLQAANAIVESMEIARDKVTGQPRLQDDPIEIARLLVDGLVERLELASAWAWFSTPVDDSSQVTALDDSASSNATLTAPSNSSDTTSSPTATKPSLTLVASAGLVSPALERLKSLFPDNTPLGRLVQRRTPLLSNNLQSEAWIQSPDWIVEEGLVGFAGYPIFWGETFIGCIATFSRCPLGPEFLEVLQFICSHAGSAITNARQAAKLRQASRRKARLLEQFRQQAERQALLFRMTARIRTSLDLDEILQAAVDEVGYALQASRVQFLLGDANTDRDKGRYRHAYAAPGVDSWLNREVTLGESSLAKQLVDPNQAITLRSWDSLDNDAIDPLSQESLEASGVMSLMAAGLNLGKGTYGILSVHQCHRDYQAATTGEPEPIRTSSGTDNPELSQSPALENSAVTKERAGAPRSKLPIPWSDGDAQLLEAVAEQLTVAINQSRLYEKLREQARREALLNEIGADIYNSLDPKQVLEAIEISLANALDLESCTIQLFSDDNPFLPTRVSPLSDPHVETQTVLPESETLDSSTAVFEDGCTTIKEHLLQSIANGYPTILSVNDLETLCSEDRLYFKLQAPHPTAILPLMSEGVPIGTIVLVRDRCSLQFTPSPSRTQNSGQYFDDETLALAASVAEQASIALKQAQLYEQTRRLAYREGRLRQFAQRLTATYKVQDIIHMVLKGCAEVLGVDRCDFITLSSQETPKLAHLSSEALQEKIDQQLQSNFTQQSTAPVNQPAQFTTTQSFRREGTEAIASTEVASDLSWLLLLTCYGRRTSLLVDDVQTHPMAPQAREALLRVGIRSFLAVPVILEEDVLGIICAIFSTSTGTSPEATPWSKEAGVGPRQSAFAAAEMEIVEAIADMTAVAVQRTQFSEQARMRDAYAAAMRGLSEGREAESKRLAADLHDQTIADLGALSRQIQQLAEVPNPDDVEERRQELEQMSQQLRDTIAELRIIVEDLQPTAMRAFTLASALRSLMDRAAQRSQTPLLARFDDYTNGELDSLEQLAKSTLFRIVQEALNNVVKHAGATRVDCAIRVAEAGYLEVKVIDNGKGMPDSPYREGSHGLLNMRYRAELIGGTIEWKPRKAGSGTVTILTVPLVGGAIAPEQVI